MPNRIVDSPNARWALLGLSLALVSSLPSPSLAASASHSNAQESSTTDGSNTDTFIAAADLASGIDHLVIYTAGYGGASDADQVGARIVYGTTVLGRSIDEGSASGLPESVRIHQLAGYSVITGNGTDELRIKHQIATGTGFISGKGLISIPLAGLTEGSDYFVSQHNDDVAETTAASTTFIDVRSVAFDLPDAGNYLVLASMEATMSAGAPEGGSAMRLQIDAVTQKMEWAKEWETDSQSQNFAYAQVHSLPAASNTFVLQGATSQGTSIAGFRRSRIIVLRAASFDQMTSTTTDLQSATAQTFETSGPELGWDTWLTNAYTPNQTEDVVVIGNGFAWPGQNFRSTAARLQNTTDGTIFSELVADDPHDLAVDRNAHLVTGFEQISAAKTYALQLSNEDNTVQDGIRQYGDLIVWSMTPAAFCGDGTVDAGEECDNGTGNGTPGQCCSATCGFESVATLCRASAGICDVAETCSGASGICPIDGVESGAVVCRPTAGACDTAELCNGSDTSCPLDGFASPSGECRPSAGVCDVAETCSGTGPSCPSDGFASVATECRASGGLCDVAETCTGAGASCPADVLVSAATECRASAGVCDVAEACDGATPTCPVDGFVAATVECRGSAGFCDVAETCTGVDAACPGDSFKPASVGCRGPKGSCDAQEDCTGSDALCPADGYQPNTTVCRSAKFACDVDELCTGTGTFCPSDQTMNVGDACTDGDTCTLGEQCQSDLVCGAGEPLSCDDGNACTADSCDSVTGCGHAVIQNCAAGVPATSGWGLALLGLTFTIAGAGLLERHRSRSKR